MTDTNLMALLISVLAQKAPVQVDHTQTLILVIAALAPTLAAIAAYIQSRANQAVNAENKKTIEEVHVAVNSGAQQMRDEIKVLTQRVLELSQAQSISIERERAGGEKKSS